MVVRASRQNFTTPILAMCVGDRISIVLGRPTGTFLSCCFKRYIATVTTFPDTLVHFRSFVCARVSVWTMRVPFSVVQISRFLASQLLWRCFVG